jgi:23S rRNA G2445 N2-methylase RlmL
MIKAIINVIGIEPGMTILDPMGGSGTTVIEAATMGIAAFSYDISPFCTLMARAKIDGLWMKGDELAQVLRDHKTVRYQLDAGRQPALADGLRQLVTLAYLDSRGYAERTENKNNRDLFHEILTKYAAAIQKFASARDNLELPIAEAIAETADARALPLPDESVDGIVFSPPYSFAVDYVENDLSHLAFLGHDVSKLRHDMVGLRGRPARERVGLYFEDMRQILQECRRVLKRGRFCVVVVGSNTSQLRSILRTSDPTQVSVEHRLMAMGYDIGLPLMKAMVRQITGLANVMRDEHILFFKRA